MGMVVVLVSVGWLKVCVASGTPRITRLHQLPFLIQASVAPKAGKKNKVKKIAWEVRLPNVCFA